MDDHQHEYRRSSGMVISELLASVLPAVAVAIWLPDDTQFLMALFLIYCVIVTMGKVHFHLVEKHVMIAWYDKHMREVHGVKDEE